MSQRNDVYNNIANALHHLLNKRDTFKAQKTKETQDGYKDALVSFIDSISELIKLGNSDKPTIDLMESFRNIMQGAAPNAVPPTQINNAKKPEFNSIKSGEKVAKQINEMAKNSNPIQFVEKLHEVDFSDYID